MIVGTNIIDLRKLSTLVSNFDALDSFVLNLIPLWARHIKGIVDNQRYLVAINIRSTITIPYRIRKKAVDHLVKDIHLTGYMNQITTLDEVLSTCNLGNLIKLLVSEKETTL